MQVWNRIDIIHISSRAILEVGQREDVVHSTLMSEMFTENHRLEQVLNKKYLPLTLKEIFKHFVPLCWSNLKRARKVRFLMMLA